jgi:predicted Zn-dependent protease
VSGTSLAPTRLITAAKWVAGCVLSLPLTALLLHRANTQQPTSLSAVRANQEEPASAAVVLDVTQRMLSEGRAQDAIPLLNSALLDAPKSAALYNNLCVAHGLLKQRTLAIFACESALKLAPDLQLARSNLVWVSSISEDHR